MGLLLYISYYRYGIGADYFAYSYLYRKLDKQILYEVYYGKEKQEVGFRALGSAIKAMGFSYQSYLLILSFITLFFIYKICVKYSKNPMLSMTAYYSFYYFVWTLSSLRQGLAMAVGMFFLLEAINKNRVIRFLLVSVLLFYIHSSSLIFVVMFIVARFIPWSKKTMMIILSASILFSFLPMGDIVLYLSQYSEILGRTKYYIDSGFTIAKLLSFSSVARLILIGVAIFFYDDLAKESPEMKNIVNIYLISFIIYYVFQFSEITAARLSIYGRILDFVILPSIIYLKSPKINKKVIITCVVMFICIYFLKELNTMKIQSGLITEEKYVVKYSSIYNKSDRYYNTHYYYVLYYRGRNGFPKLYPMIQ